MRVKPIDESEKDILAAVRTWAARACVANPELDHLCEIAILEMREEHALSDTTYDEVKEEFVKNAAYRRHEEIDRRLCRYLREYEAAYDKQRPPFLHFYFESNEEVVEMDAQRALHTGEEDCRCVDCVKEQSLKHYGNWEGSVI